MIPTRTEPNIFLQSSNHLIWGYNNDPNLLRIIGWLGLEDTSFIAYWFKGIYNPSDWSYNRNHMFHEYLDKYFTPTTNIRMFSLKNS